MRRLGSTFSVIGHGSEQHKLTFFDGLIFVTIQICLRTGLVTFGNQVVCRLRNSAALSYPHLLGGSTVSNQSPQKKHLVVFANGGEPPYILPSISKVVTWPARTFDVNRCDLASSCQHDMTRPFVWGWDLHMIHSNKKFPSTHGLGDQLMDWENIYLFHCLETHRGVNPSFMGES